jgi:hypothetical protein
VEGPAVFLSVSTIHLSTPATEALGAPFKPSVGLSGLPCLPALLSLPVQLLLEMF